MVENSNNFLEPLTDEDKKLLSDMVLKFQIEYYALIKKYPNPKKFLEFMNSKWLNSELGILLMISLSYLKEKKDDDPFSPKELRKFVKETLGEVVNPVFIEIVEQLESVSKNLNPRAAREKILERLENSHLVYNLSGIDNYKEYFNQSPGRKSSFGTEENNGGRRSIYLFEDHILAVRRALRKKESIDYIHNELSKNSLIDTILLFLARLLIYIMRQNDRDFLKINYFARFLSGRAVREDYYNEIAFLPDKVKELDNSELKQLTNYLLKTLKEDKHSLVNMVFFIGIFKL